MACVVIALLAASASCDRGEPALDDTGGSSAEGRPAARAGIRFEPARLANGGRVGEMVVESLQVQRALDSTLVGRAWFRGPIELSGRTIPHFDADARATQVCFEADDSSAARLPRWSGDERRAWFCFDDAARAARLLAPPGVERPARIVLDRLVIHRGMSDEVNVATLADPSINPRSPR